MKKRYLASLTLALALVLGGCSFTSNSESSTISENLEFVNEIEEVDTIYGFATMSSTSLLNQMGSESITNLSTQALLSTRDVTEEDVEKINSYINMFEGLLSDEGLLNSTVVESDLEGYDYKMIITTKNLLGEVESYVMYYNELIIVEDNDDEDDDVTSVDSTSSEVTSEDDDDVTSVDSTSSETTSEENNDDSDENLDPLDPHVITGRKFDREHDDKNEVSTKIEGIMIIDEVQYEVIGRKQVEEKDGKVEIKTSFISRIDHNNFVKVIQKSEQEANESQQKFVYEVVSEGQIVSKSEVKISQENEETKVELKIFENDVYSKYEFKREVEEGKEIIMVKVIDGEVQLNIKVFISVDETTGESSYVYHIREGKEFSKTRHHDDEYKGENKQDRDHEDDESEDETETTVGETLI